MNKDYKIHIIIYGLFILLQVGSTNCFGGELTKANTLILESQSNGGYYRARIFEKHYTESKPLKVDEVKYYADDTLIKKLTHNEAAQQIYSKIYRINLANPNKKTKLQPVKHKWVIKTPVGVFEEEKILYVFEKYDGHETFIKSEETEPHDELGKQKARFKFRKEPSKQPPVVNVSHGTIGNIFRKLEYWELRGIDNGKITKAEYYIDGKLIQMYNGKLPHRFEIINPDRKELGSKLKLLFKVYDDENNITEVPAGGIVRENTRTESYDEDWMYLR